MRKLIFEPDGIILDGKYDLPKGQRVGVYELLWTGITTSPCQDISKKEYKIIKRLKKSLRSIGSWKDDDRDSRILDHSCLNREVILENDEYEVMIKLFDANKFIVQVADQVADVYDIIESAQEVSPTDIARDEQSYNPKPVAD